MFDGELSAAECELLARRLSRDEALRAQWSRFALIGAALRAERGVILHERVAWRVQSAIAQEPSYGDASGAEGANANPARVPAQVTPAASQSKTSSGWMRFARPVFGTGIAAGVAAVSILWLRTQEGPETLLAAAPASESITLTPEPATITVAQTATPTVANDSAIGGNGEPERYSTPAPSSQSSFAPPAHLANYVVAHSEYSAPLARRMALLGIVSNEVQPEGADASRADQNPAEQKPAGAAGAP
jgi:negative regulator of sigma E activity